MKSLRYLMEESCEHGYFGKHVIDRDPAGDTFCCTSPVVLLPSAIVLIPVADGLAPDWLYEWAGNRLEFMGGTDQWEKPSYRVAYLALVWRAMVEGWAANKDTALISTKRNGV